MLQFMRKAILGSSAALALAATAGAEDSAVRTAQIVPGTWQHHQISVNYFGITSLYTCDGLEEHVRSILLHLGARQDTKVYATGCARGPDSPSHAAFIRTDFYTLQPADSASAANEVRAYWAPRELTPQHPYFMGGGDCELVEQLKDLISTSFAMRDVQYHTDCVPHEISLDGFTVKGEALVAR